MKYYLQVLLAISVYMSHFDPFHSMCWVFISRDTRDFDIIREADRIASKVSASLWEAASCATPDIFSCKYRKRANQVQRLGGAAGIFKVPIQ